MKIKSLYLIVWLLSFSAAQFIAFGKTVSRVEFHLAENIWSEGLTESYVNGTTEKIYLHKEALITNKEIVSARAVKSPSDDQFIVEVSFTDEGAARLSKATEKLDASTWTRLAIIIDGKVIDAPYITSKIHDYARITGNGGFGLSFSEAKRIADIVASK